MSICSPTEHPALEALIWRGTAEGQFVRYVVPARDNQTVLDVVTYIQRELDPTLSYRFACRVGMCGSCAMTVNGVPRWTCRTHVRRVIVDGRLQIGPLRSLRIIKDLAVDMTAFFDKWSRARGQFAPVEHPSPGKQSNGFAVVEPSSTARQRVDAGIECIGCGVCYSACDLVEWRDDYLGPAALNRAWTLVNDVRDRANETRLRAVSGDAGCHACHSHQSCHQHCPKHLNPTAAIAGLKRAAVRAALKGQL